MLRIAIVGLLAAAAVTAQSPLTTTLVNNNAGAVGGGVYFDLTVNVPITATTLDVTLNTVLGTVGSIDILTCPVTRVGNQLIPGAWTLLASGAVTSAGASFPTGGILSSVAIPPTPLPVGTYGVALRGVGQSFAYTNGTGANQTVSTTEVTLNAGEASNTAFAGALFTPRVVGLSLGYSIGGGGGTVLATNTAAGAGCYNNVASFYENFGTAAAFDMSNNGITMLATGSGYVVIPGGAFIPVGSIGTSVPLALTDDSEVNVPFTSGSFPGWTGLQVCSNGFVSQASNGVSFTPATAAMLAAANTGFWSWHDYNPATAGSGQIKVEQSAAVTTVTWDGVFDFGGTGANTMQMQFYPNGNVTFAWQTMSLLGNGHLVGYSPGGPNIDPGNTNLSALTVITLSVPEQLALRLAATSRPITGTSWNLNVTNIPAAGVIGVEIIGLTDPAIADLFFIGAPGCGLRASLDSVNAWIVGGPSHPYSLGIPANPALLNIHLYSNAAVLVPGVNTLLGGTITSNGIDGKIGDF